MRETGWLIEHDQGFLGRSNWLRISLVGSVNGIDRAELVWTEDANAALRFARAVDARNFALLNPTYCTLARITEHAFIDRPADASSKRTP